MKSLYKGALLAVLGLASVPMAHAAYPTGDLLVGFTTSSGTDVIYDLGSESSIMATAASVGGGDFGGGYTSWNLSSILTADYGSLSGLGTINWGVVGATASPFQAFITTTTGNTPATIGNSTQGNKVYNAVAGLYADLGTPLTSDANSWNSQTLNPTLGTQFQNVFDNPNSTGITSADFYSVLNNNSTENFLGTFSLSAGGILTLDAVPEPSTYALALLGGFGMLVFSSRNKLRKQA